MVVLSRGKTKLIDRKRIRPTNQKGEVSLKTSVYKSYDDLPLFLNADTVASFSLLGMGDPTDDGHRRGDISHDLGADLDRVAFYGKARPGPGPVFEA